MAEQIILPRQGQSVETCLILNWKKKEGEEVSLGEVLVEVETDKAAFEIESTAAGTLLKILHQEGEDVPVLSPLAIVGEAGEDIAALSGTDRTAAAAAEPGAAAQPGVGGTFFDFRSPHPGPLPQSGRGGRTLTPTLSRRAGEGAGRSRVARCSLSRGSGRGWPKAG